MDLICFPVNVHSCFILGGPLNSNCFSQVGFSGRSQHAQDVGYVLFSFFNVLWASIYLEAWKRYSAELAYRWGTLDQRDELLVEPRPLYTVMQKYKRSDQSLCILFVDVCTTLLVCFCG